mmetsp:Transcript_9175/g.12736  ORF Transcript_9175/g.12736 Transcript_9175/m.12736 type:complete len:426 (-) Transcript_9175:179-1456(-)
MRMQFVELYNETVRDLLGDVTLHGKEGKRGADGLGGREAEARVKNRRSHDEHRYDDDYDEYERKNGNIKRFKMRPGTIGMTFEGTRITGVSRCKRSQARTHGIKRGWSILSVGDAPVETEEEICHWIDHYNERKECFILRVDSSTTTTATSEQERGGGEPGRGNSLVDKDDRRRPGLCGLVRAHRNADICADAAWRPVDNLQTAFRTLREGSHRRTIASTAMNSRSSRSHTILNIRVAQTNARYPGVTLRSDLVLVDLAGSERQSKSKVIKGARLKELKNINLSLHTLEHCMLNLSRGEHAPFRQSCLTRLLESSLNGRTQTSMLVTCASNARNLPESRGTLLFAERAGAVRSKANATLVAARYKLERIKKQYWMERKRARGFYLTDDHGYLDLPEFKSQMRRLQILQRKHRASMKPFIQNRRAT